MPKKANRIASADAVKRALGVLLASDMANCDASGYESGVRVNIAIAILAGYAAHVHLTGGEEPDTELTQRVQKFGPEEYELNHLRGQHEKVPNCWIIDQTDGATSYMCDTETCDEGRLSPCPSCPAILKSLPNISSPLKNLQPVLGEYGAKRSKPETASTATARTLKELQQAAAALIGAERNWETASATILIAEAAHATVSAASCHSGPYMSKHSQGMIERFLPQVTSILKRLHRALGRQTPYTPPSSRDDICHHGVWQRSRQVEYICFGPNGQYAEQDRTGTATEKCAGCPWHTMGTATKMENLIATSLDSKPMTGHLRNHERME